MKKKSIILLIALLCAQNVEATPIYSEYKFVGYTQAPLLESENFKYELVHLHKYYSDVESDVVYAPLNTNMVTSRYIDKTSTINANYYFRSKSELGNPRPIFYTRIDESYLTKYINITNFSTGDNNIFEIEVLVNDEKIDYNISSYSFLNDGDITSGDSIMNGNITITLPNYYALKDIKLLIHFNTLVRTPSYFTILYVNDTGTSKRFGVILDTYLGDYKTKWLEFKEQDEFVSFLVANKLMTYEEASNNVSCEVYEYSLPLYKYYDLKREFYAYSFLDEIDGYFYDSDEDINLYKVYAREFIGEETYNIQEGAGKDDTCESNFTCNCDQQETKESEEVENNKTFIYKALPVKNEENEYSCPTYDCESCECHCELQNDKIELNDKKRPIIIYLIISIIIVMCLTTLKIIRDKFTDKN